MFTELSTHSDVQDYYGKTLTSYADLKTNVCCTKSNRKLSQRVNEILSLIHEDVIAKYYGCGLVFPEAIEGCKIVDLGSGSGRDCYILSCLVGPEGFVTGIDMTKEQVDVARQHIDYHTKKFGYKSSNVMFLNGYIEDLEECGIPVESTDIIVSNCVINLCPNKQQVFQTAYTVLKFGGEMYFSDIYADRTLSEDIRSNKVLYGECIGGALEWQQLMKLVCEIGFAPPVLVDVSPVTVNNPDLQTLLGDSKFCSATYRLFKIRLDDSIPSQAVTKVYYKGTIPDFPSNFKLAHNITISKCSPVLLPMSVAQLLMKSRLASHFIFDPVALSSASPCPELAEFVHINPFDVMAQTMDRILTDKVETCCSKSSSCC